MMMSKRREQRRQRRAGLRRQQQLARAEAEARANQLQLQLANSVFDLALPSRSGRLLILHLDMMWHKQVNGQNEATRVELERTEKELESLRSLHATEVKAMDDEMDVEDIQMTKQLQQTATRTSAADTLLSEFEVHVAAPKTTTTINNNEATTALYRDMVMRKRAEVRRLQQSQLLARQAAERQRALEVTQQLTIAANQMGDSKDSSANEAARQALEKSNAEIAAIQVAQAAEQADMDKRLAEEDAKLTAALDAKLSHQRVDHHAAAGSLLSVCLTLSVTTVFLECPLICWYVNIGISSTN
jgi:hypothetical protein